MKGKWNIMTVGENLTRKKGSLNIIFPIISRLLGSISSGLVVKGTEILGKKSRLKKIGVGKNIKLKGTLFTTADIIIEC